MESEDMHINIFVAKIHGIIGFENPIFTLFRSHHRHRKAKHKNGISTEDFTRWDPSEGQNHEKKVTFALAPQGVLRSL